MQAVIMAGGKGTRLAALTKDEIPKPMVEVAGKPLLLWQVDVYKRQGKDRVQKWIAGADKLTGAGMELQLVPDPGGVVQGLSRFPGGQEGLDHLPVVLHIMTQLPVLAFPPLDRCV